MGDFCDPGKLSEASSDKEVPNAGKSKGFEGTFHELRSDPHGFIHRTRKSLWKTSPQLQESLNRTSSEIVFWMQKGSPWRAFLVSSVGVVLLLGLAGLGTFMLFFLAATLNAVAIAFLASVASVGAFAALFFTTVTTIYIGVLVMASLTISTITLFCICAALTAAGWIAFLWVVWQGLKKGADRVRVFSWFLGPSFRQ